MAAWEEQARKVGGTSSINGFGAKNFTSKGAGVYSSVGGNTN